MIFNLHRTTDKTNQTEYLKTTKNGFDCHARKQNMARTSFCSVFRFGALFSIYISCIFVEVAVTGFQHHTNQFIVIDLKNNEVHDYDEDESAAQSWTRSRGDREGEYMISSVSRIMIGE